MIRRYYYDDVTRTFSLSRPKINNLMNIVREEFSKEVTLPGVSNLLLGINKVYTDRDQMLLRSYYTDDFAEVAGFDPDDEPDKVIPVSKLWFIGRTGDDSDSLAVNITTGEVFEIKADYNPPMISVGKDIVRFCNARMIWINRHISSGRLPKSFEVRCRNFINKLKLDV